MDWLSLAEAWRWIQIGFCAGLGGSVIFGVIQGCFAAGYSPPPPHCSKCCPTASDDLGGGDDWTDDLGDDDEDASPGESKAST
jgi:hypothetical protein